MQAQAVAARTYAWWSRAQSPDRYYQICDTSSCQVYKGYGGEHPAANTAVDATRGQILTYGGRAGVHAVLRQQRWPHVGRRRPLPAEQGRPVRRLDRQPRPRLERQGQRDHAREALPGDRRPEEDQGHQPRGRWRLERAGLERDPGRRQRVEGGHGQRPPLDLRPAVDVLHVQVSIGTGASVEHRAFAGSGAVLRHAPSQAQAAALRHAPSQAPPDGPAPRPRLRRTEGCWRWDVSRGRAPGRHPRPAACPRTPAAPRFRPPVR